MTVDFCGTKWETSQKKKRHLGETKQTNRRVPASPEKRANRTAETVWSGQPNRKKGVPHVGG